MAIPTSTNQAYGVTLSNKEEEESFYSYPQVSLEANIETKQNASYATSIITEQNDAYAI